jgi:competence protein ComEA
MTWKEYFNLSRGQSRAAIILVSATVLSWLIYFTMPLWAGIKKQAVTADVKAKLALIQLDSSDKGYTNSSMEKFEPAKLTPFKFDPNTLDEAGFKKLGLRDKLISTLLNYRNKGGKFYNKESLKRIYGLHPDEFAQLEPYIDIPNERRQKYEKLNKPVVHVELNSADTSLLVQLNGVGSKTAWNIVQYRERLGGFAQVNQLQEVFGISPENYERMKPYCSVNPSRIKKINLSEATYAEINAHPYLKGELAKAITDFRKAKSYQLKNLNELKEIPLITDEIFRKIAPYLTIQ